MKRYDIKDENEFEILHWGETPEGEWVRYDDVEEKLREAQEAKNRTVKLEDGTIVGTLNGILIQELKERIAELEKVENLLRESVVRADRKLEEYSKRIGELEITLSCAREQVVRADELDRFDCFCMDDFTDPIDEALKTNTHLSISETEEILGAESMTPIQMSVELLRRGNRIAELQARVEEVEDIVIAPFHSQMERSDVGLRYCELCEADKRIVELDAEVTELKRLDKEASVAIHKAVLDGLCHNCGHALRPGQECKQCKIEAEHSRHVGENS